MASATYEQIVAVGRALLPYLRDGLSNVELASAVHDAVAALAQKSDRGLSASQRLAIVCGNQKHYGKSSDLDKSSRYCTCCEKPLSASFRWLELDQRSNTYHDRGDVPEDRSQGWFPFGLTCARKLLASSLAA